MESLVGEDEKLDELFDGRIRIIQKKAGYRFSLDAVLLAHFAARIPAASVIDLGTGSGIVPLILARKSASAKITGVEVQPGRKDHEKIRALIEAVRKYDVSATPDATEAVFRK